MDGRRALHAIAFGALVAVAAVGVFLAALLVTRPRDVVSVAQNVTPTPTGTAAASASPSETPRPTQTAIATGTPTQVPPTSTPTGTPAPTETPAPTSTPRPPATNTPELVPTTTASATRSPAAEPFCVPMPSLAELRVAPGQAQSYPVTFAGACRAHPRVVVENSFGMSLTIHRPDGGRDGPWEIRDVLDLGALPFQQGTSSLAFAHGPAPQCVVSCSARVEVTWLPHE